jgi:hypothetical protein
MELTPNTWLTADSISRRARVRAQAHYRAVQIDELRRALRESEWRRQAAEIKLADRERQLGRAHQTIAAQDRRIVWLTAEVARLGGTAATNGRNGVWRPGPRAA